MGWSEASERKRPVVRTELASPRAVWHVYQLWASRAQRRGGEGTGPAHRLWPCGGLPAPPPAPLRAKGSHTFAQRENAWVSSVTCVGSRIKKYFLLKCEGIKKSGMWNRDCAQVLCPQCLTSPDGGIASVRRAGGLISAKLSSPLPPGPRGPLTASPPLGAAGWERAWGTSSRASSGGLVLWPHVSLPDRETAVTPGEDPGCCPSQLGGPR